MANLLLTQKCVRSCPYCFAKKQMAEQTDDDVLSWENFMYVVDFFALSETYHLSLLGGEPTLHPEFVEFVLYLHERNFDISVFTSAIMSEKIFAKSKKAFKNLSEQRLFFICNVNHSSISPPSEILKQTAFLETFGKYVTLSYNIYTTDFDLSFLADYINKYKLRRVIRLGLTHPILGENNKYIDSSEMTIVGKNILKYYNLFEKNEIKLNIDCGYPLCMFDDDSIGKLYKLSNKPLSFSCGAAMDIGTDLNVWPCFPLSGYEKKSLYDFSSFNELKGYYTIMMKKIREEHAGIYKKCITCIHLKSGLCSGGCGSYILRNSIS